MHIIRKNYVAMCTSCFAGNSTIYGMAASHPTAATVARYVDVMLAAALFKPQTAAQVEV